MDQSTRSAPPPRISAKSSSLVDDLKSDLESLASRVTGLEDEHQRALGNDGRNHGTDDSVTYA